jgi:hypothetical protein
MSGKLTAIILVMAVVALKQNGSAVGAGLTALILPLLALGVWRTARRPKRHEG